MWRMWNYQDDNRGPYIGHPALVETTVEDGYLETIPEAESVKSRRSSCSATLPDLPFRVMPPMLSLSRQQADPTWSQPASLLLDRSRLRDRSPHDQYHVRDVSPLSSAPKSTIDANEDTPISPIESELAFGSRQSSLSHPYRSRIPQRMTSGRDHNHEASASAKQETKWDAYSGEPTKDDTGVPSAYKSGFQPLEYQYPQLKERTRQILAGIREREAASKSNQAKQQPPIAVHDPLDGVVHKVLWKGPGGRTTLLVPIQNDLTLQISPVAQSQTTVDYTEETSFGQKSKSPSHTLRTMASEESIKPVAPLKIITKSRGPSVQTIKCASPRQQFHDLCSAPPLYQHPRTLQSPFSSPSLTREVDELTALVDNRTDSPPNDVTPNTPRTPTPPLPYQTSTPIKLQQMPNEPDISRFSWTTYATSAIESPGNVARIIQDDSPAPPVPQLPRLQIKKRPVPASHTSSLYENSYPLSPKSSIVPRKPVGGKPRVSSATVSSDLGLSKTLPQIPPEWEAPDKIANFEAQLDALSMRKHNTSRIIRDLNESLKRNAIVYDIWKRKEVNERIMSHQAEMQSISNEEYDIALRLHRALKKRDIEDNYEIPTGLWIRRVTS